MTFRPEKFHFLVLLPADPFFEGIKKDRIEIRGKPRQLKKNFSNSDSLPLGWDLTHLKSALFKVTEGQKTQIFNENTVIQSCHLD